METRWSDIIIFAKQFIDDVRWADELVINPAQFFRAKSQTLAAAIPMLNKPPELLEYLESGILEPEYDDTIWVSTAQSIVQQTTVSTGKSGFELCSVSKRSEDGVSYFPYNGFTYNEETGDVVFNIQEKENVEYSIDFYTDGKLPNMTAFQRRLLARAIAIVYDEKFQRNWLANTAKIHDSSFNPPNESNYMDKSKQRYIDNLTAFEDELRTYEQKCAYKSAIKHGTAELV